MPEIPPKSDRNVAIDLVTYERLLELSVPGESACDVIRRIVTDPFFTGHKMDSPTRVAMPELPIEGPFATVTLRTNITRDCVVRVEYDPFKDTQATIIERAVYKADKGKHTSHCEEQEWSEWRGITIYPEEIR